MSTVNEWDNEYARLARIASQLRSSGTSPSADARQLSVHLQRLDEQLNALPISPADVQRRRRLIQHMQQGSGAPDFVSASAPASSPAPGGGSQMAMAMQKQDDMISELAVGVGRLRDQTQIIGDEARMHVNLLGEMESNLDAAHNGLESETRRAAQLKEDQSVWRLQLTVAGLSIVLVLLILAGIS
eukprot:Nitzschia sp. Nitz4//scaffold37_size175936//89182//89739//NITZ4_002049-RA/size175936-processed-gene-0.224-mRNA-1//-1//CDS//3329549797//5489//frame0